MWEENGNVRHLAGCATRLLMSDTIAQNESKATTEETTEETTVAVEAEVEDEVVATEEDAVLIKKKILEGQLMNTDMISEDTPTLDVS